VTFSSAADDPVAVEDNILRAEVCVRNLLSYSTSSLSSFYWAESSAAGQEFNNSVSKNIVLWNEFAEILETETSPSISDVSEDPCLFGRLDVFDVEGDIVVPLQAIFEARDARQSGACLAFLVSEFAVDLQVSQVVLTSRPQLFNFRARSIQQVGKSGASASENPFTAAGLTGFKQVVGVTDTGLDDRSCYFIDTSASSDIKRSVVSDPFIDLSRRKVVQYSRLKQTDTEDLTAGHGTHVTGTVVGYNEKPLSSGGKYSGVAPGAQVAFLDIASSSGALSFPPVSMQYSALKRANARVCSNSWGGMFKGEGYYAGGKIDGYLYKNMNTLVLFASGNSGMKGLESVSREASSKNVVSVGASEVDNVDSVAFFSSLGPTYDGRIKPDIVSPGAGLFSAQASKQNSNDKTCETTFKQGTSMATPAAAGAAALLRQYFQDREGKFWTKSCSPSSDRYCAAFTPSGMLLKALLVHSGEAMSNYNGDKVVDLSGKKGKPDVFQGFGRVQLSNVLPLPGKTGFQLTVRDMVDLKEKSSVTHTFKVTDSSRPLVVTISWYDPPAVSGAAKALVNDLDLVLQLPNGKGALMGNMKSSRDAINNNERIVLRNPGKGKYRAVIKARALPVRGRQRFAFVLTYAGSPINPNDVFDEEGQNDLEEAWMQKEEEEASLFHRVSSQMRDVTNSALSRFYEVFGLTDAA